MKIGILGGGQLGRMLAMAGQPLDLQFRFLDPARECPAEAFGERVAGDFDEYAALSEFLPGLDVITYEFENVPVTAARWLDDRLPVWPPPEALEVAQDRLTEKQFFQSLGANTPAFHAVESATDFRQAIDFIGLPGVLKTRRFGYDGKGQAVIRSRADAELAWERLSGRPLILEAFVPFDREVSLIACRAADGNTVYYPLIENEHFDGILRRSFAPKMERGSIQSEAEHIAAKALERLNYVGVLTIEFFQIGDRLIVNEMAPRVHNSGHWSIEGAATSQFSNHLRAITGWPLGETRQLSPAAMINIIGERPNFAEVMAVPGTALHWYGKLPRPNRKVGHITILADDFNELSRRAEDPRLGRSWNRSKVGPLRAASPDEPQTLPSATD